MLEQMARHWWTLAVRGVLAIILGILAFLAPGSFARVFVLFLGAYFLVDGVFALVAAFRFGHQDNRWWALILEGVLGIIVGILTSINPLATAAGLVYLVAAWALVTGVMEIVAAIQLRKVIEGEFLLGLTGLISILLGLALFRNPVAGIIAGAFFIGAYALLFGILLIALAFRLRGMSQSPTLRA